MIEFKVNGERQTVRDGFSLETTLNEYIRDHLHLKGTKVTCHEGGCGVCMVNGTFVDKTTNEVKNVAINSCLFPLYSCDQWEFTTIEGVAAKARGGEGGCHVIQKRLADYNGSQCGYCSPGFVMSMYSLLLNDERPDKETIESAFDSNICRCTGYRAILDAMKSFAKTESPIDDIEDLHQMRCLDHQSNKTSETVCVEYKNSKWYSPTRIDDLIRILEEEEGKSGYKIVAGNTAKGLYKEEESPQVRTYINTLGLSELYKVTISPDGATLTIGANLTLTALITLFRETAKTQPGFEYLAELAKLFSKVANTSVRNMATWSGNLVLKHSKKQFPSDLFIAFKTVDAQLSIKGGREEMKVNLEQFLQLDSLNGRFVHSIELKRIERAEATVKLFKIMPRSQSSYHYVTAGFMFPSDNKRPRLVFGGVSSTCAYLESTQAAEYLQGKDLKSNEVFKEACRLLELELSSSGEYKKSLALALFYKFVLTMNPAALSDPSITSAIESLIESRPVSSGEQNYSRDPELYPLTQPMPKSNSYAQTSGKTVYNGDLPPQPGQLNGAFILSNECNGSIESIDIEKAMAAPGVKRIIFAKDIPGVNNLSTMSIQPKEELFASDFVSYNGQPLGLVVAETEREARYAASLVNVKYKDLKKPVLTINDALEAKSIFPPIFKDFTIGDSENAFETAKNVIEGEFSTQAQYHFYMENHIAVSTPTENGYEIDCSTQWLDLLHKAVTQVLNTQNSATVEVRTKQIGGGFGGKATRPPYVGCAAAVASAILGKPVRVALDLNTNMRVMGKRHPVLFKYKVGFDENGRILGMKITWYTDAGYLANDVFIDIAYPFFDNVYSIANWHIEPILLKTNTPVNTALRAPFAFPAINCIEYILDHVALHLKQDPLRIRRLNMYKKNDVTMIGQPLPYFNVDALIDSLMQRADYEKRFSAVEEFNRSNRWKKRGISIVPMRYGAVWKEMFYTSTVTIFNADGGVLITHSGVEMGQGINTKVAQVAAHMLGIPFEMVNVRSTNNSFTANSMVSGGSVTTELIAKAVIECCTTLKRNLDPARATMPENYTWRDLIAKAFMMHTDLTARYWLKPDHDGPLIHYDVYAVACTEAAIDVLTGETQVVRTDILYDCGRPINGMIDIGQAEGGFMIGLGFWLLEDIRYNPENGRCITESTLEYHPPLAQDIPVDLRISFLEDSINPVGVLGAKCIGEPPLCLSISALFACKRAIEAARLDVGNNQEFNINAPLTPKDVQTLCLTNHKNFEI